MIGRLALALALAPAIARADRPVHGSVGAGTSIVITGAQGDHFRYDIGIDLKPRSRYGVSLAWRTFDADHRGMVLVGIVYEGAAARPRLVLDLHADIGVDLDHDFHPLLATGVGIRTALQIVGPLAVVVDLGPVIVWDGVDNTRLQLMQSTMLGARW